MTARGMLLIAAAWVLAACTFTVTPEPDRVATRVAEDLAVAQTLTAVAPPAATPTKVVVRNTPIATSVRPTTAPTATPTPSDPTVPGFGSPNGLEGRITLPGYTGPLDAPVFEDNISFRLSVFDPTVGNTDGAGITAVKFTVIDPTGNTVLDERVDHAAYCAFSAAGDGCAVWQFSAQNFQWPNGASVCAGPGYTANMFVEAGDPNKSNANWGFIFAIASPDGQLPQCQ